MLEKASLQLKGKIVQAQAIPRAPGKMRIGAVKMLAGKKIRDLVRFPLQMNSA